MQPVVFRNKMNGERFVCDNIHLIEQIDGIEYLSVHRPNHPRLFKMRKDALERVDQRTPRNNTKTSINI
jgi:hypothetical protein